MESKALQSIYEAVYALMTENGGGAYTICYEDGLLKVYSGKGALEFSTKMTKADYREYLDYSDSLEGSDIE